MKWKREEWQKGSVLDAGGARSVSAAFLRRGDGLREKEPMLFKCSIDNPRGLKSRTIKQMGDIVESKQGKDQIRVLLRRVAHQEAPIYRGCGQSIADISTVPSPLSR